MECRICGTLLDRGKVCSDCRRWETARDHAQTQADIQGHFQKQLFENQLFNQRKILEAQVIDSDFREVRRLLLDLELQALDNEAIAENKVLMFLGSSLFREHRYRLMESLKTSDFLLTCYAKYELQELASKFETTKDLDWSIHYLYDSRETRAVYEKMVYLIENWKISPSDLPRGLAESIVTFPARRDAAKKQREEDAQKKHQLKIEEFHEAWREAEELASTIRPKRGFGSEFGLWLKVWLAGAFALTSAQRERALRLKEWFHHREHNIQWITERIHEIANDFSQSTGYKDRLLENERTYVLGYLWIETYFDSRLLVLLMAHLFRLNCQNIRAAVIAAYDEFEISAPGREMIDNEKRERARLAYEKEEAASRLDPW